MWKPARPDPQQCRPPARPASARSSAGRPPASASLGQLAGMFFLAGRPLCSSLVLHTGHHRARRALGAHQARRRGTQDAAPQHRVRGARRRVMRRPFWVGELDWSHDSSSGGWLDLGAACRGLLSGPYWVIASFSCYPPHFCIITLHPAEGRAERVARHNPAAVSRPLW